MGLLDRLKLKAAEIFARNLAEEIEAGKYGQKAQTVYVKTKGQKTFIGAILTTITLALVEFAPPQATEWARYAALIAGGLTSLGLLDRARRSEPVFPLWFLQTLAQVSLWISGISALVGWLVTKGLLFVWFPDRPGLADDAILYATALSSATALLNRLAAASAAQPKPTNSGAVTSTKESK